ncbi:MAG TPA: HAD-IIIA family hydrolase, partial [Spirochaetota bacterium]|nr:HAD-IIIA family hydrolase [Spirochaetota bacterium]
MKKAIVFDRDGTLIKDKGYIKKSTDVEFYKIDINLMQALNKHFLFFIVSNQAGIGKGLISDDEVKEVNLYIEKHFKEQGIHFTEIFYCPHSEAEKCHCRKPEQFFMEIIKSKYNI